jgi:hypothetical protein
LDEVISDIIGIGLGHTVGFALYYTLLLSLARIISPEQASALYYCALTIGNLAGCLVFRRSGLMPRKYFYFNVIVWPTVGSAYFAGTLISFVGLHFSAFSFLIVLVFGLYFTYAVPFDAGDIRFRLLVRKISSALMPARPKAGS